MNSVNILSKDIIKEWKLESLSDSARAEALGRISRILYQAILVKSLDILSGDEQTKFDLLLEDNSTTPQDVLKFLQQKIPTFDLLVIEERKRLKEDLLMTVG